MKLSHLGKVYRLSYPFTDASDEKSRPTAIVIEEDDDFEVLYITRKQTSDGVRITAESFIDGGLSAISYIKVGKSIPYSKKLFTDDNYLGTISKEVMIEVLEKIVAKYQIILEEVRQI